MMRRFAVIIFGLMLALTANAGVVIDRIVATVNNHALLQSDWDDAVRFEAFMQGRMAASMTDAERRAALDRLIDQELLRQQMPGDFSPMPEQIAARELEVRAQVPGAESEQGWHAVLDQYELDEALLREKLTMQLQVLHFVDLRLRPTSRVDREEVETYYNEKLVPEMMSKGVAAAPLSTLTRQIRELLTQQHMDELLTAWLSNLRTQSAIHIAHAVDGKNVAQGGTK